MMGKLVSSANDKIDIETASKIEMSNLTFNEELHEYHWNGKKVPGVTTILAPMSSWDMVPEDIMRRAQEFGTHVHTAIDLMLKDDLDYDSLDPALKPYVDAAAKFIDERNAEIEASEIKLFSDKRKFAGTADAVLRIPAKNYQRLLVDWKTGMAKPITVGPQTSAYADMYKEMFGKTPQRGCVNLLPNGTYKYTALTDTKDKAMFQSCLNIYNKVNR